MSSKIHRFRLPNIRLLLPTLIVLGAAIALGLFLLARNDEDQGFQPEIQIRDAEPRAYTGLTVTERPDGLYLGVDSKSPAEKAGLRGGDRLLSIDGQAMSSASEVYHFIEGKPPGSEVTLVVWREVTQRTFPQELSREVTGTVALEQRNCLPPSWEYFRPAYERGELLSMSRMDLLAAQMTPDIAKHFNLRLDEALLVVSAGGLPHTPAAIAGIQRGDIVLTLAGQRMSTLEDLSQAIEAIGPDKSFSIDLLRCTEQLQVTVPPLGPDLPGANSLPKDVRERLIEAIESGNLARERLDVVLSYYRINRLGPIQRIDSDSITIEAYGTGERRPGDSLQLHVSCALARESACRTFA